MFICAIILFISLVNGYPSDQNLNSCLNYCSNDGICLLQNNQPICYCLPEWEGERCDLVRKEQPQPPKQIPRNTPCSLVPTLCKNGGVCFLNQTKLACQCAYPGSGPRCEDISVCYGYCLNGGFCTEPANPNTAPTCECPDNYDGFKCQVAKTTTTLTAPTTTTNELCTYLPDDYCGVGVCVFNGGLSCSCPPTHTGERCETVIGGTQNPGPPTAGPPTAGPPTAGPPTAGPSTAGPPTAGPPTAGPPTAGPPTAGPPTAGPPTAGPSTAGPPTAGPPTAGPPTAGPPTAGPPTAGPPTAGPTNYPNVGPLACSTNPCKNGRPCYNNGNTYYCYCGTLYNGINCENPIG